MKPKNKIYPLLRMLAVALTAALLGPGCQKDFKWNEPLAVTQNGLNLTSAAGSTRVTVYSTGRWKAEMAEGAWGEVSEVSGNGIGDFLFTYEANNGVSRRARILVSGEGEEQEIVLTQAGAVTDHVFGIVAANGGSISAEHGIGRAKSAWTHLGRDATDLATMRAIKDALDPRGTLNPGVIFP